METQEGPRRFYSLDTETDDVKYVAAFRTRPLPKPKPVDSVALALAQCPQVTTLGDRTAGSSGNPRRVEAGAGIIVNLPRWIDMDPEGKPIDVVGIAPRVKIETKPEDFQGDQDPVLAAALENLRKRPKAETSPEGGALQSRRGDDSTLRN